MKKNVAILIGGKSVEHEVSIITGLQVLDNIDLEKYNPIIVYISKNGYWYVGNSLYDIKNYKNRRLYDIYEVLLAADNHKLILYPHPNNKKKLFSKKEKEIVIDIVFPAMHGTNAEDGSLHGFFQMNDIPCCFGSVLSSSVGMDKVIMKKIFKADNLPIADYIWFYKNEYYTGQERILSNALSLGYPLIVKPANLGSSVGIGKANNKEELLYAINVALNYDKKIIIEKCIQNAREINCAVLGYENMVITSLCEEPTGWKDFLTFEDKYISHNKTEAIEKRKIPADIDIEATHKIIEYAKAAFLAIDCSGNARIDFLYDGNNIYVNEINTIPGSIAFYLWEKSNIPFKELISRIIEIAEICQNEKMCNIVSYDIDLLRSINTLNK